MTDEEDTPPLPIDFYQKQVDFLPGYDDRDLPKSGRGAKGGSLRFTFVGSYGAISFTISTGWMLRPLSGRFTGGGKQARQDFVGVDCGLRDSYPNATASVHSTLPYGHYWEGKCDLLSGGKCYSECVNDSEAARLLDVLVEKGDQALWSELKILYRKTFIRKE